MKRSDMKKMKRMIYFSFWLVSFLFVVNANIYALVQIDGPVACSVGKSAIYTIQTDQNYYDIQWWQGSFPVGNSSSVAVFWDFPGVYYMSVRVIPFENPSRPESAMLKVTVTENPKDPDIPYIQMNRTVSQYDVINVDLDVKVLNVENMTWSGDDIDIISGQGTKNPVIVFKKTGKTNLRLSYGIKGVSGLGRIGTEVTVLPHNCTIEGPEAICEQSTYFVDGLSGTDKVSWSLGSNNASIVSGQNMNNFILNKKNNGSETITANVTKNGCSFTLYKNIEVLILPSMISISGRNAVSPSRYDWHRFEATPGYSHTSATYEWNVTPMVSGVNITSYNSYCDIVFPESGQYWVTCKLTDICGHVIDGDFSVRVGGYYRIASLANGFVEVELADDNIQRIYSTKNVNFDVINLSTGQIVRVGKFDQMGTTLDLSALPKGVYNLRIKNVDNQYENYKVILQ